MTDGKEEKEERKSPHEAIILEINVCFLFKDQFAKGADKVIQALGNALNEMIITENEILEIKNMLLDIITATPIPECNMDSLEALRKVIQTFRRKHPDPEVEIVVKPPAGCPR